MDMLPEISEHIKAIREAELITRAQKYGMESSQLGRLENLLAQGAHGMPPITHAGITSEFREKDWMIQAAGIGREIGEEKAMQIVSDFMGFHFPDETTFAQALEQLPEVARSIALKKGNQIKILQKISKWSEINSKLKHTP